MKKFIIIFLTVILITGCGSKNKLKCTSEDSTTGDTYKTELNFNFKDNKVSKYQMKMNVELKEENISNIEYYYNSFEATFDQYKDQDGVDLKLDRNEKGYSVNIKIDSNKYNDTSKLFNKYLDLESTKTYYENLGYICK